MLAAQVRAREAREPARRHRQHHRPAAARAEVAAGGAGRAVGAALPGVHRAAHARFGPTFTVGRARTRRSCVTTDRDAIRRLLTGDPARPSATATRSSRPLIGDRSVLLLEPAEHLAAPQAPAPAVPRRARPRLRRAHAAAHGRRGRRLAPRRRGGGAPEGPERDDRGHPPGGPRRRRPGTCAAACAGSSTTSLFYPFGALRRCASRGRHSRAGHAAAARCARSRRFAAALPTPAVTTYFPELKVALALERRDRRRWWRHRDELLALLDEQIAATRADPRLAEREDILAMLVQARDEDGDGLRRRRPARRARRADRRRPRDDGGGDRLGRRAARARPRRPRARGAAPPARATTRYLDALVKEVLRIRPPLPVARPSRVLDEPFAIGDHTIPPGTPILVDGLGLHHDPALLPRARGASDPSASSTARPSRTRGCPSAAARTAASARRWPSSRSRSRCARCCAAVDLGPADARARRPRRGAA